MLIFKYMKLFTHKDKRNNEKGIKAVVFKRDKEVKTIWNLWNLYEGGKKS